MTKTTQKDIAAQCGVSAACVGYILSGSSKYKFKQETIDLVKETAERLCYRPNQQAASLRRKENKLIICIVGNCCRHSDVLHIQRLEEEISKYGYHLLVHFLVGLPDDTKINFIKKIINLPAGIMIWSLGIGDPEKFKKILPILKKAPPALHMSHPLPGSGVDFVKIQWGGESLPDLINFFREKGFKRVGCCLTELEYRHNVAKSFIDLAENAGMRGKLYHPGTSAEKINYFEDGRKIAAELLAETERPDAIYCTSDEVAFSIIELMQMNGIQVPRDLFIVRGGDSEYLKNRKEPLPYLIHDIPLLVSTAAQDLISRIEEGRQDCGTERCVGVIPQHIYFPEN